MLKFSARRIVFCALIIAPFLLMRTPASAAANGDLTASLSSTTETINAGDPIYISYEVENRSAKPIRLPAHFFSPGSSDGTGLFFSIINETGEPVNTICMPERVEFPDATVVIQPGEFHGRKSFNIAECFKFTDPGEYTVAAQFSSSSTKQGVWKGVISPDSFKIKVRESDAKKKVKIADALIAQWLTNYDYTNATDVRKKIISLGTPASLAVITALKKERRLLAVNDLLDILGSLPCLEAADYLIEFAVSAPSIRFVSNMPEGFSSSSILMETAFRSLEKIFSKSFNVEDGNTLALWSNWEKDHRDSLPPAIQNSSLSPASIAAPKTAPPAYKAPPPIYPEVPYPDEDNGQTKKLSKPRNGGKIK
ncbi:MAG: hypothetical protein WCX65_00690 [bacterium]